VPTRSYRLEFLFERVVPWFVLTILAVFTYASFFVVPYTGFEFTVDTVILVFDPDRQAELLEPEDRLIQVGFLRWDDYLSDMRQTVFHGFEAGQRVPILVERDGEQILVNWTFTGPTREQLYARLSEHWWLSYIFWIAGMATLLYIRPKDIRWRLLIALNFLTAIWLAAGSGSSRWHIWGSIIVLSSAVFLSLPVYLQFHWVFPQPLLKLPRLFWLGLYAGAVFLVILTWFNLISYSIVTAALIFLPVGSIILLVLHALFQEDSRRLVLLLASGIAIVLVPPVLFDFIDIYTPNLWASTYIALPAFPAAYFFAIYKLQYQQLENRAKGVFVLYLLAILASSAIIAVLALQEIWFGYKQPDLFYRAPAILLSIFIGLISALPFLVLPAILKLSHAPSSSSEQLELRSNRLVSLYLFFTLLGLSLATLIVLTLAALPDSAEAGIVVGVVAVILAMLVTALGFEPFQRAVERRLLGIPLPPTQLLETYSASITTSLDRLRLAQLLRDELLPSLLIRQSALLRVDNGKHLVPLYLSGVEVGDLPSEDQVSAFLGDGGLTRPFSSNEQGNGWVQIVFPLRIRGDLIGLWLLGRRDPDDLYTQSEIPVLQSIANQTAIALANIQQAELLRTLYQANIERQESGDSTLALFLHDEVLNSLAHLMDQIDPAAITPRIEQIYARISTHLRQTVQGLRPTMLAYGLHIGLEDLVDDLNDRAGDYIHVDLQIPETDTRHDPRVEQHLFRIVQQACENTLRHAKAHNLIIFGQIEPGRVLLDVVDDGIGFQADERVEFGKLLAERHYGLFGMYQRAGFIGARIRISSAPGTGTQVSVSWSPENSNNHSGSPALAAD
jgi:signal transduction histidine kinase